MTDNGEEPVNLSEKGFAGSESAMLEATGYGPPYDPSEDREKIRGSIAQILIWTLVAVIGGIALVGVVTAFDCLWRNTCSQETSKLETVSSLVTLIVTPLVGLVGAVTGFYYGEKAGK